MPKVVSINGEAIKGTLERVYGVASCDAVPSMETGKLQPDVAYHGETDINWDTQETIDDGYGGRIFVDETGAEIPEHQVFVVTDVEKPITPEEIVDNILAAIESLDLHDFVVLHNQICKQKVKVRLEDEHEVFTYVGDEWYGDHS